MYRKPFRPFFRSPLAYGAPPIPPPRTLNLILDGNSLTAFPTSYAPYLPARIKSAYTKTIRNFAVSGQTTAQMLSDASTQIDLPLHLNASYNIIFVMEGINHLFLNPAISAQTAYNSLRTYCLNRQAYGFKVIVGTLTPRSEPGTQIDYDDKRRAVNTLLRANWQTFASAIMDIGGHPLMGQKGDSNSTAYYLSDKVHFAPPGAIIVADLVAAQVNSFLP